MVAIISGGGSRQEDGEEVIWIDSTISVTPSFTASVTEHPLSSGVSMSDHVYRRNTVINVNGVIGGNPLPYDFTNNIVDSGPLPTRDFGGPVNKLSANPRVQAAYDALTTLYRMGEPFDLICELERYENCVITSLSIPQDVNNLESLTVDMQCEQLRIVTSDEIQLFIAQDKQDDAAGVTNKGTNTKEDAGEDEWFQRTIRTRDTLIEAILPGLTTGEIFGLEGDN